MLHDLSGEHTYVQWDGTDDVSIDPNSVLDAISEDLMRDGNVDLALQKAFRWGMPQQDGTYSQGLRDLMERLKQQREELLEQFNFDSVLGDIPQRLSDIIDAEQSTVNSRIDAASSSPNESDDDRERLLEFLNKKRDILEGLPQDAPGRISSLKQYDFVDRQAGQDFEALLDDLQQQVSNALFQNLMGSLGGGESGGGSESGQSMEEMGAFLKDVNDAIDQHRRGEEPDLERLNNRWGHMLGGRVDSVDQLMQRLQSRMASARDLMSMLSPEQRAAVQSLMAQAIQSAGLGPELQRLQQNLGPIYGSGMEPNPSGYGEQVSLDVAMNVLERAARIERAEASLRDVSNLKDLQGLDPGLLEQVLSEEDAEWLNEWKRLEQQLIDSGLVDSTSKGLELTPRAIRRIGEHALADIFSSLKQHGLGDHDIRQQGKSGELAETSSPWQFGDSFSLDLSKTVMNGLFRNGPGTPVHLGADSFEVLDREARTSTATVLLIDMSRSMLHNGCWDAAKRAALALDTLIRSKYPRDMLELVGFSAMAHPLKLTDLPKLEWNEYTVGTNLQHALEMARTRLRSERGRNRQIIVITDGEPTAHIENGEVQFNYPPLPSTFEATLREVLRCTREDITINTFLLEQSPYMSRFVEDLMRINKGRVMNASPNRLGSYVLKDFLQQRTVDRMTN
ncbi:MAG: VWA domain-containing protein [Chloroflexota bacterium]|nr:VWA domain-containing protein [Chloroflexota bacterium]